MITDTSQRNTRRRENNEHLLFVLFFNNNNRVQPTKASFMIIVLQKLKCIMITNKQRGIGRNRLDDGNEPTIVQSLHSLLSNQSIHTHNHTWKFLEKLFGRNNLDRSYRFEDLIWRYPQGRRPSNTSFPYLIISLVTSNTRLPQLWKCRSHSNAEVLPCILRSDSSQAHTPQTSQYRQEFPCK